MTPEGAYLKKKILVEKLAFRKSTAKNHNLSTQQLSTKHDNKQ